MSLVAHFINRPVATTLMTLNVLSRSSTRRLSASFTNKRPPGSARMLVTVGDSESVDVACTAPSGRTGGRV